MKIICKMFKFSQARKMFKKSEEEEKNSESRKWN